MEKTSVEQESTSESTVHLWTVPRRNQAKPSKDALIAELYSIPKLKGLDFRPLNVADMVKLIQFITNGSKPIGSSNNLEKNSRLKATFTQYLEFLGLESIQKLPLSSLKGLAEYFNE